MRAGLDAQVAPRACRIEIDARGAHAKTAADRALRHRNAFLVGAVVVVGALDPDALRGLEQALVERTALVDIGDPQYPAAAALIVGAAVVVLDVLEDREDVVPAPAAIAELCPVVIVVGLPAHPHHAVDRARPAEHFSARHRDAASTGHGLRLRGIEPVHAGAVDEARVAD